MTLTLIILVILPWLGGLILIGASSIYLWQIIHYQTDQLTKFRTENNSLRENLRRLEDENSKLQLAHQTILIENAMLSAKHDQHRDD